MAAQVQSLAPPDTVVISPATLRLVEGYVVTQALGTYRLDDASEPLVVSQVLQAHPVQSRFAVTVMKGLHPAGGPGAGGRAVARALGAGQGRPGAGGRAQRRGWDRQIAAGAGVHRASGGGRA